MIECQSITPAQWEANRWAFIEALAARLPLFRRGAACDPIIRTDRRGRERQYYSVRVAASDLHLSELAIRKAIARGGSCGGYRWRKA